eukprot:363759-Chlamydomonas_euryale.AAC.11
MDFTKAYDSISREALWEVLKLYGVRPHVIKLQEDLHTGTEAVVRVGGEVGRSFTVKAGVRQGRRPSQSCPPTSNLAFKLQWGSALPIDQNSCIVALMYADDLALLSDSSDDLLVLLCVVDAAASKYRLLIYAAKTEIMVIGRPTTLPTFKLSDIELLTADGFKYLGSFFAEMDRWEERRMSA